MTVPPPGTWRDEWVGLRAEAGIRRRGEGGEPGAMFPPDCAANHLCLRCASRPEVNGEQGLFAGGGAQGRVGPCGRVVIGKAGKARGEN